MPENKTDETKEVAQVAEEKPICPMKSEDICNALELGKTYDFEMAREILTPKGKQIKRIKLGFYKLETRTFCDDGEILNRFAARFNQTLMFLNKDGIPQGDFGGYVVESIKESEPVFNKYIATTESAIIKKATEVFGEDAAKVVEFIRDYK